MISARSGSGTDWRAHVNPIDRIWADRPAPSDAKLIAQSDAVAGKSSAAKRADIADLFVAKGKIGEDVA